MIKYEQIIIYYFSGTGNARNAAHWFKQVADANQLETKLINIDRFEKIDIPDISKKNLIGFCSPTHGFNLPHIMLKFIMKFPKLKNADVFIMNTRGGLKLSKIFLPGLSGLAQILPALILILKSYRVVGMQPLDLPSNWLFLHPGLKTNVVNSMQERIKKITENFATRLIVGKTKYKALLSLPFDFAITPIAVGYYLVGRFFLAKTLMVNYNCNSCMKCINECPVEAIKQKKQLFWSYKCEGCMRCINSCPKRAIEIVHGFSFGMILIWAFVLLPGLILLLKYLGLKIENPDIWLDVFLRILKPAIFITFVFLSYRMVNVLMRHGWIHRFIMYTSLSRYKFWRRYKAPHF